MGSIDSFERKLEQAQYDLGLEQKVYVYLCVCVCVCVHTHEPSDLCFSSGFLQRRLLLLAFGLGFSLGLCERVDEKEIT